MPPQGEGWETERVIGGRVGGIVAEVLSDPNPVEQQLFEDQDGKFQGCGSNWTGELNWAQQGNRHYLVKSIKDYF